MSNTIPKNFEVGFLGIGAPRCGTTWIHECLEEHPEIDMDPKEKDFFTYNYQQGAGYYAKFFTHTQAKALRGRFTVGYLAKSEIAAPRIKNFFPRVKLLVSLRNPAERIISHYRFHKSKDSNREALLTSAYIEPGFYYKHIMRYLEFFDRRKLHIMLYDDIVNNPREVLRGLYSFLGVRDASFKPPTLNTTVNAVSGVEYKSPYFNKVFHSTLQAYSTGKYEKTFSPLLKKLRIKNLVRRIRNLNIKHHQNTQKTNYHSIPYDLRKNILKIYENDIRELEKFLERDLSHWRKI